MTNITDPLVQKVEIKGLKSGESWKVDPNIALSDTGFLFHAATGDSFSVNPTGLRIIHLVKSNKTVEEMVASLVEEYNVEAEQAEEDLFDYLQYLRQLKILTDE